MRTKAELQGTKSKQESKNSTKTKIKSQRKKETNKTIIGQIQGVMLRLDKSEIKIKRITSGRQNLRFSEVKKTKVVAIKADEPSQITKYNSLSVNK